MCGYMHMGVGVGVTEIFSLASVKRLGLRVGDKRKQKIWCGGETKDLVVVERVRVFVFYDYE